MLAMQETMGSERSFARSIQGSPQFIPFASLCEITELVVSSSAVGGREEEQIGSC